MPVRSFAPEDIPQVAELYWTVSRERRGAAPIELQSGMQELYFKNPWIDGPQPSLVFDDNGKITGFLGVVPRRMSFGGRSVLTAFGGNFVVHPHSRATLAGLHLLRAYMLAGQDLSLTDSANDMSRVLLERLGFRTILAFSVHWIRVLRPARFATFALSHMAANAAVNSMEFMARPFCRVMDRLAGSLLSPFRQSQCSLQGTELDVETLLACQKEFRNGYSLWPEYDARSLTWLLDFMARMKGHGDKLRKILLRDQAGKIVGWYIYSATPGGLGEVVQISGDRRYIKNILDHLFHDAWNNDVTALRGIVDRHAMPDFSEKNCFFTCRGGWMVAHSNNPDFLGKLNENDAFLSRLDGEWCLAFGT
jgi:hypothetical protein